MIRRPTTPPILLVGADFYYGTLAATRVFGRAGIPVTVADPNPLAAAGWSRYANRRVRCPSVGDGRRLIDWLIEFGRSNPRHVLYPTADDSAWLYARYREELEPYFYLYQPPVETIYQLVNKWNLGEVCAQVNVQSPRTWKPESKADLEEIARTARFPLLIKPRTQTLYYRRDKGARVESPDALMSAVVEFDADSYAEPMLAFDPSVTRALLQEYHREASTNIYGLSGFIDEAGVCHAMRASHKVLQRPKELGVGLCFEGAPVRADLAQGVIDICRHTGFYGIFEVEFVDTERGPLMLDFNPRLFNQMAFDIDREAPWPLMIYYGALGDVDKVKALALAVPTEASQRVFTHSFWLKLMLKLHRMSGTLPEAEATYWAQWYRENRAICTDAVADRGDRVPAVLDAGGQIVRLLRHPRSSLRNIFREYDTTSTRPPAPQPAPSGVRPSSRS